jgi:hypothetical protein
LARFALLKEIAPHISKVVVLSYPGMTAHDGLRRAIEAGKRAIDATAGSPDSGVILLPRAIIEIDRLFIIDMALLPDPQQLWDSENSKANPINSVKSAGGIWEKFVRWSREK